MQRISGTTVRILTGLLLNVVMQLRTAEMALLCSASSPDQGLRPRFHERDHSGSIKAVASGGCYLASGGTDEMIKSVFV